jgi:hypothetical protein
MTTSIAFHDAAYGDGYLFIKGGSIVSESIAESGTNQQSGAATKPFVTVCATAAVYVAIGADPVATTATTRTLQPANVPRTYGIDVGHKVAVVTVA